MLSSSNPNMCLVLKKQQEKGLPKPQCKLFPQEHQYLMKIPYREMNIPTSTSKFLWIDTFYVQFNCDVQKMLVGDHCRSNNLVSDRYPAVFHIIMSKATLKWIVIEFHRTFRDFNFKPDNGYFLRIYFQTDNSLCPGKYSDMPFNSNMVSVPFLLSNLYAFYDPHDTVVIKGGIWMYEIASSGNEAAAIQEQKLLASMQDAQTLIRKTYDNMAYLLDRKHMSGIFSGRQHEDFANPKIRLLKRTLLFADVLARRSRCLKKEIPFDNVIPIALILGYIYSGISRHIEMEECLELFKMSYVYGLSYLQEECSIFLAENLADSDILIDVILEAIDVEHWRLLALALVHYARRKRSVDSCDRWKQLMIFNPEKVRIIQTLVLNETTYDSEFRTVLGSVY